MDTAAVIHRLQKAVQADSANILSNTGGPSWLGRSSSLTSELAAALHAWKQLGDPKPILGIVELFATLNLITEQEAAELRDAITAAEHE